MLVSATTGVFLIKDWKGEGFSLLRGAGKDWLDPREPRPTAPRV